MPQAALPPTQYSTYMNTTSGFSTRNSLFAGTKITAPFSLPLQLVAPRATFTSLIPCRAINSKA